MSVSEYSVTVLHVELHIIYLLYYFIQTHPSTSSSDLPVTPGLVEVNGRPTL